MRRQHASFARKAILALMTIAGAAGCAQNAAPGANPEQPGAVFQRPQLAADDVRAFPAAPAGFADERTGIAHGRVEEFSYDSAVTGTRRKASVYLPAGYAPDRHYPVLYLLHGIAGNQDEWRGYVHATAILDNLIADGKAVPMIVVMPNGRALADDRPPPEERKFAAEHVAGFAAFERELFETLIPAIDRQYATLSDRRHRAIAGLSMGGGQALNFGLGHLESFSWVGGFSAAPNTAAAAGLLPDAARARSQLDLLYLSCGNQDGLFHVSQQFHRYLKQNGIPHVWNVDEHGHDRESWADNLYHFTQLLFR
ncbi:MAG TPA: alpha/beta hydrolase-fold protein [Burkholderiaceae bacterium]